MIHYDKAKSTVHFLWMAFQNEHPDIDIEKWQRGEAVELNLGEEEDFSFSVTRLLPYMSVMGAWISKGTITNTNGERIKEDRYGLKGEMNNPYANVSKFVLPFIVSVVDQIDPDTAPGPLHISQRVRDFVKKEEENGNPT